MKRGELAVKLERWEPLAPCAACFLLTAVLCGAQLFGGYAPFTLGLVAAAGSGKRGLAALLGGVAGALVFLDFYHALRTARRIFGLNSGDNVVMTGGMTNSTSGNTNLIKVETVQ